MIEAAKKGGEKSGGEGDIGNVAAANSAGAKGNEKSVRAIASGMKGIVDAAKKAGVELKAAAAGANGNNKDAGKLFNAGGHADANAAAVNNAVKAVSGVSGDQILNAIVTSDSNGNGKNAREATNPIEAAIGTANGGNNQAFDKMTADDKIAAAIVLRGMANGGKFALDGAARDSKESLKA